MSTANLASIRMGSPIDISATDWTSPGGTYAGMAKHAPRAILIGTGGNIVGRLADDTADQTYPMPAGMFAMSFTVIRKTGTTAATMIALY